MKGRGMNSSRDEREVSQGESAFFLDFFIHEEGKGRGKG